MKVYTLEFFSSVKWRNMTAEVLGESESSAKASLILHLGESIYKRGNTAASLAGASIEEKKTWIDVIHERELISHGILSIRLSEEE